MPPARVSFTSKEDGDPEVRTYDESTALLLVGARQPRHGVEDLDARVIVDKDRVRVVLAVRLQNALAHPHPVISQQKTNRHVANRGTKRKTRTRGIEDEGQTGREKDACQAAPASRQ